MMRGMSGPEWAAAQALGPVVDPASVPTAAPADRAARTEALVVRATLVHDAWTSDGIRLALTEVRCCPSAGGKGPAFLLLPGFAQNRRAFLEGPFPEALLARGAQVFVGELRGHGLSRSERRPPRWTIESHIDRDLPALVRSVLRLSGACRVHLVGHSMGGLVALGWLGEARPVASLTTLAVPIHIGGDRPIVRLAAQCARVLGPIGVGVGHEVPIDAALRILSGPLSTPRPGPIVGWLQTLTALANPREASPAAIERVLARADPESPAVWAALVQMAQRNDGHLAGRDLARHGRALSIPWLAVHGERDIFAPPSSMASLEAGPHAGPRAFVRVPRATHVDLVIGHHTERIAERMWSLLFQVDIPQASP